IWMGLQPDGGFLVSSGQRVEGGSLAFSGRPIDLAMHPSGELFAILNKSSILLGSTSGIRKESEIPLGSGAGFRGIAWHPDGTRLFASTERGFIQSFRYDRGALRRERRIEVKPPGAKENPAPGGIAITRDGTRMFVAAANRNAVAEVDLARD